MCGFLGDTVRECRCTPQQIARYRGRLSGPLRDRIDLIVEVPALPPDMLGSGAPGESSASVRARVVAARERQRQRASGGGRVHEDASTSGVATNGALTPALMARHCRLDRAGLRVLSGAVERLRLTARGYDRVRKVARTIADLTGEDEIGADQLAEALQYRML